MCYGVHRADLDIYQGCAPRGPLADAAPAASAALAPRRTSRGGDERARRPIRGSIRSPTEVVGSRQIPQRDFLLRSRRRYGPAGPASLHHGIATLRTIRTTLKLSRHAQSRGTSVSWHLVSSLCPLRVSDEWRCLGYSLSELTPSPHLTHCGQQGKAAHTEPPRPCVAEGRSTAHCAPGQPAARRSSPPGGRCGHAPHVSRGALG